MSKPIEQYYKSLYNQGVGYIFIAIISFALGLLAITKWGDVGAGIIVIFGSYGIYQVIRGFWTVLVDQTTKQQKITAFERDKTAFLEKEIKLIEKEHKGSGRYKTYNIIAFLIGIFYLFMGAFRGWSEIALGLGAALAAQSTLSLIMELVKDYRRSYYLQKLRKLK